MRTCPHNNMSRSDLVIRSDGEERRAPRDEEIYTSLKQTLLDAFLDVFYHGLMIYIDDLRRMMMAGHLVAVTMEFGGLYWLFNLVRSLGPCYPCCYYLHDMDQEATN